jgi:ABC-2 type transport system ATP-binding protein
LALKPFKSKTFAHWPQILKALPQALPIFPYLCINQILKKSTMLEAIHLHKSYQSGQKIALNDFSFQVPQGCIYGLLGPNGAGKTSLIRIINQITQADRGEVLLQGERLNPNHIKAIGYMPEERGLYKNMSIGDQILYFARLKGLPKDEALRRAKYWFDELHIEHWWKKKLGELSKGMAQKIQFVVTVLHQPPLLILDEPFSGFDPINAQLIKQQILKLKAQGTTVILSTHRMESVEEMCDRVALINLSHKILDGTVQEVRLAFKNDSFLVKLSQVNPVLFGDFAQKHELIDLETQQDTCQFKLKSSQNHNDLLQMLMPLGKITHFEECLPSMNEVFIQAIQKSATHL